MSDVVEKKGRKTAGFSFRFPPEMKAKWEELARQQGTNASDLVRELMLEYMASYVKPGEMEAFGLTKKKMTDLIRKHDLIDDARNNFYTKILGNKPRKTA